MTLKNNPTIFFKYHDKNISKEEYEYINNLINIAIEHNIVEFKTSEHYDYSQYNCDIIVNSNLYSNEPKILSAGGFSFLQASMISNKKNIVDIEGNWNDLLDPNTDNFRAITTSGDPRSYYGSVFPTTAIKFDNMPICFSFPILPSSVDSTQFLIQLNNGMYIKPLKFTFSPNTKFNEKQCMIIC